MSTQNLIEHAIMARQCSYSPHSHYKVGAALLTSDGTVYYGTNIENDSYGLTICAERSAIFSAISNGINPFKDFMELAVVTKDGGTSCGACRQVMLQFNIEMLVHFCVVREDRTIMNIQTMSVKELLPHPFKL